MALRPADFQDSPVGDLKPITGHDTFLKRDYRHVAFVPKALPDSIPLAERTYCLVADAQGAIGRLDFAVKRIPDPTLLVRPTIRREAVSTSALEGTYAPLTSVFEADYTDVASHSQEVREVVNYVRAAEQALELIAIKPICTTVIAQLQKTLVQGTRGDHFDAGQLRTIQVFIGERAAGIENSRFVPPPPGDDLVEGVSAWEKWINTENDIPLVAKLAIGHYQFETLHPFSDGNGRLGRLIAILQLVAAEALAYPVLNLSPWLEPRKDRYKDLMLQVSRDGDYNPWIQFFSEGVIAQANDAVQRIEKLLTFRSETLKLLKGSKGVVLQVAEDLIGYPFLTATDIAERNQVTYPPAANAINRLVELNILEEVTGRQYRKVYRCPQVMAILTAS
ncbi:MAG: Fic family protein [Catenulispora sp.]